jgi:hypothetical protein
LIEIKTSFKSLVEEILNEAFSAGYSRAAWDIIELNYQTYAPDDRPEDQLEWVREKMKNLAEMEKKTT